ncbi:hypothetical protein ACFSKM_02580 [Ancylobacter dichloromethanicus]
MVFVDDGMTWRVAAAKEANHQQGRNIGLAIDARIMGRNQRSDTGPVSPANQLKQRGSFNMPLPTEPVGSLPRPVALQNGYAAYDAGTLRRDELEALQDAACADTIRRMEATAAPVVSDGEQRISSFATYPLMDTLGGTGLADNLVTDGQYFCDLRGRSSPPVATARYRPVPLQDLFGRNRRKRR